LNRCLTGLLELLLEPPPYRLHEPLLEPLSFGLLELLLDLLLEPAA
jgi:hypothetical protein